MTQSQLSWLIAEAGRGRISRREFLGRASALGIAAAAAPQLFGRAYADTPKKGGHMRIAMGHGATTDTLEPSALTNGLQWCASYGVANTLTELSADGTIDPGLATEWEASADAKTWTFKLREGVVFHNGKTLTSEDVIASVNIHRGDDSKSVGKPIMAAVTDVRADGPNRVVFELSGGNADFPYSFDSATFGIYPAKDGGGIDWESGGSGGYILKEQNPGVRYTFERNPNYWRDDQAHAASVELLSVIDATARSSALLGGQIDVIDQVDLKTIQFLAKKPGLVIEEGTGPLHYTFPMLMQTPPFDNLDLRKAVKYALDREEMVKKVLGGHGVVGNDHPIGPSYRYHAADIEQLAYDPDKAKFHLEKSGLGAITLSLSVSDAAFAGAVDAGSLFQASAAKAGVTIDLVREPADGYWSNVWGTKPWVGSYWGGYATADEMFTTGYAPGAAWNDTQWDHPRFNELMVQARAELNDGKRRDMYREMQVILRDEGGAIVPMFANVVIARNEKIAHGPQSWLRALDGRRIMDRWWMVA
jgi:peptide/nickel transport system substrate-binding protein